MTTYDDLLKEEADAHEKFDAYERECSAVAELLLRHIRRQLGWPEEKLGRAEDPAPLPEGTIGRALRGGWFDQEGRFTFDVKGVFLRTTIGWRMRIYRENGSWFVSLIKDEPVIQIDPKDPATFASVTDQIINGARANFEFFYPKARL